MQLSSSTSISCKYMALCIQVWFIAVWFCNFRCFALAIRCAPASKRHYSTPHWKHFPFVSSFTKGNGHHQVVESHIRKKLDSLLKESRIGDKEDTDSFSIRALLRATHQGLQKNLRQVKPQGDVWGWVWRRVILVNRWREEIKKKEGDTTRPWD